MLSHHWGNGDVDLPCFCWPSASVGGCDIIFVGVPLIIVTAVEDGSSSSSSGSNSEAF
jgi:hypothetical protein